MIHCSACARRFEVSVREEYLIKMGLIRYDSPIYCGNCK